MMECAIALTGGAFGFELFECTKRQRAEAEQQKLSTILSRNRRPTSERVQESI